MRTYRTSTARYAAAAALGLTLALTLTACADDSNETAGTAGSAANPATSSTPVPSMTSPSASPSASPGVVATEHNQADITFVTDMAPHHQGALDMAQLAATRADDPQVKALAARIAAAQGPEIAQLQAMAQAWGVQLDAAGGHSADSGSSPSATASEDSEGPGMHGEDPAAPSATTPGTTTDSGMDDPGMDDSGMDARMQADMAALEPLSGAAFDREFLTRMSAHHQAALPMARAEVQGGSNPQATALARTIVADQTVEIAEMQQLLQG